MKVQTLCYQTGSGWSAPFPKLDSEQTAVIMFGGTHFLDDPGPVREVIDAFPNSKHVGCSTSGEIFDIQLHDDCLAVAIIQFERTRLALASASVAGSGDSHQAGRSLAQSLIAPDLRSVLVLSDGHDVNGSELIRGLRSVLPDSVVITGGLAGDADRFERTWVLHGNVPARRHVQAIGFYGDSIRVGHGSEGGWDVFGPERIITKSHGNVLEMLDGEPALPIYKKYLGEEANGLPATALLYPLAVQIDENIVVRTVLAVDEENQTLTFAGDVPQGAKARFMMANCDRLVEGAAQSARNTRGMVGDEAPVFALAVSCVGRRLVLGERVEEELEAVADALPPGSNLIGFYSYGEISPGGYGACTLHNQTMTLTTITEVDQRDSQAA